MFHVACDMLRDCCPKGADVAEEGGVPRRSSLPFAWTVFGNASRERLKPTFPILPASKANGLSRWPVFSRLQFRSSANRLETV